MKKLKDFVNVKKNKKNHQISFDLQKRKLKEENIEIKDILNMDINFTKKLKNFEKM